MLSVSNKIGDGKFFVLHNSWNKVFSMVADVFHFTYLLFSRQNAKREKAKLKREKRLTSHQSIYVRFLAFVYPFFSFEFHFFAFCFLSRFWKSEMAQISLHYFQNIFYFIIYQSYRTGVIVPKKMFNVYLLT